MKIENISNAPNNMLPGAISIVVVRSKRFPDFFFSKNSLYNSYSYLFERFYQNNKLAEFIDGTYHIILQQVMRH